MNSQIISGIIQYILFSSPDGDYTILKMVPDDDYNIQNEDGTTSVVGDMPDTPKVGDAVEFQGAWIDNPRYGTQFKITGYRRVEKSAAHVPRVGAIEVKGEKLSGTVLRITFYNSENGWGVIKIDPFEDADYPEEAIIYDGAIAVVGVMPELVEGEAAEFTGKWVNNEQYGKQFKCDGVIPISPKNKQGIIRYIADTVFGIGDVTATKIYNQFGDDTLDILDNNPERIYDVPGLKTKLAQNLITEWGQSRTVRQIMIHLQSYGITTKIARTIFDEYGTQTLTIVQTDPYQLADDVHGIGFKKADQIAQGMGIVVDAPARLRAGLVYTLSQMANDGHTYAPRQILIEQSREILGVDTDDEQLILQLQEQILAGKLRADILYPDTPEQIGAVYLPQFYNSEISAAEKLRVMASSPSQIITHIKTIENWDEYLADLAMDNEIDLSPEQQGAVTGALFSKISVLTGGPGTGKTTTLKMVINALDQEGYQYKLASPTGRAAKRLGEATEREASTIHRLLGFNPAFGGFDHDEQNPLDTDVIIIDEASMIDLILLFHLLKAITPGTHLMLVGDIDQLPSVGAGNVLNDVIDSGIAHVTRLNRIFRQDDSSHIVSNAHRINQGDMPYTDNESSDFFFFNMGDPDDAAEMIVDLVAYRLQKKLGEYDPIRDVQVIAPMYRGAIGVTRLNELLQEALNPGGSKAEKRFGNKTFRVGDKVMQTKNNYEKEVFNGDIGFVRGIDDDNNTVEVNIDAQIVIYDYSAADEQLIHAYCISTHRSQGSEYPVVVMPIMTQHYMMLQRNLIYTAITRAKQMAVLVGTRQAIKMAVDNNKVSERFSGLLPRLQMGTRSQQTQETQQSLF
ncbi:MAG: ATP-dependent RecD-like DNA helicase [Phototrophicaceae bacterium]